MPDTRSRRNREVAQGESNFQNMKKSDSIPSKTRAQENNGEPTHHVLKESNVETPQREVPSLSSTGRGFVH